MQFFTKGHEKLMFHAVYISQSKLHQARAN